MPNGKHLTPDLAHSLLVIEKYRVFDPLASFSASHSASINAVILGMTGGQSITNNMEPNNKNRTPNNTDDINENWHVGSIWATETQAYVCINNAELNAGWKVCSLEINDILPSENTTYSSHQIMDEFKTSKNITYYKVSMKANTCAVNILLGAKASSAAMLVGNVIIYPEYGNNIYNSLLNINSHI